MLGKLVEFTCKASTVNIIWSAKVVSDFCGLCANRNVDPENPLLHFLHPWQRHGRDLSSIFSKVVFEEKIVGSQISAYFL